MALVRYRGTNEAKGQLASPLSASGTTMVLRTGQGSLFPSTFPFKIKHEQYDANGVVLKRSISHCTGRTGDSFTIVRNAEACPADDTATTQTTTPQEFAVDDWVFLVVTADTIDDIQAEAARLETAKLDKAGGTMTGVLGEANGADIAAGSTVNLATATGNCLKITGNTTITSFGTVTAGAVFKLTFTGTPVITYNATSLIIPTSANITAAAGDTMIIQSLGSGNWKCLNYQRADGTAVGAGTPIVAGNKVLLTVSEAITAGRGVSLNGGQIRHTRFAAGTEALTTFPTSTLSGYGCVVAIGTDKYIVFGRDGNTLSGFVATVSGKTITYGSIQACALGTTPLYPQAVKIGTDKAAITWSNGSDGVVRSVVASVSGTTITFGTIASTAVAATGTNLAITSTATDNFILSFYTSTGTKLVAYGATVSTTTITYGAQLSVVVDSTADLPALTRANATTAMLAYKLGATAAINYQILTISGNTVSLGVGQAGGLGSYPRAIESAYGNVIIAYTASDSTIELTVGKVLVGTATIFSSKTIDLSAIGVAGYNIYTTIGCELDQNTVVLGLKFNTSVHLLVVNIETGEYYFFPYNGTNSSYPIGTQKLSERKIVFTNFTAATTMHSTVYELDEFFGIAESAIASGTGYITVGGVAGGVSGLTAGDKTYVADTGVIGATGYVNVGTAVSATSVKLR